MARFETLNPPMRLPLWSLAFSLWCRLERVRLASGLGPEDPEQD